MLWDVCEKKLYESLINPQLKIKSISQIFTFTKKYTKDRGGLDYKLHDVVKVGLEVLTSRWGQTKKPFL